MCVYCSRDDIRNRLLASDSAWIVLMAHKLYCPARMYKQIGVSAGVYELYCFRPAGHIGMHYDRGTDIWWLHRAEGISEMIPDTNIETGRPVDIIE